MHTTGKTIMRRRRGVSQILGGLFMLAIVAGVGSVLLFQGMNGINNFTNSLFAFREDNQEAALEVMVFENVRFHNDDAGNLNVAITIINVGEVEATIDTIKIIKVDTQDLIRSTIDRADVIVAKDVKTIDLFTTLTGLWKDADKKDAEYRVSITTIRGNTFETVARPGSSFNT